MSLAVLQFGEIVGELESTPDRGIVLCYWPELDTKLSMRFGRTYRLSELGEDDLAGLAHDLGVAKRAVRKRLDRLREAAPAAWNLILNLPDLQSSINLITSIRAGWESRTRQMSAV